MKHFRKNSESLLGKLVLFLFATMGVVSGRGPALAEGLQNAPGIQIPPGQELGANSLDYDILYNARPGTSGRYDCPSRQEWQVERQQPYVSACIAAEYGHATSDFDRVDDARSFTSEALFVQSAQRLGRPLTVRELQAIARTRDEFEIRDRAKVAYGAFTIEAFSRYRDAGNAQITSFYNPTRTNAVNVFENGVYAENTFMLDKSSRSSLTLGLGYSRVDQRGLLEFAPAARENVDQYSGRLGLQRDVEGGRIILNANYDYQNIATPSEPAYLQDRSIYGVRLIYFDKDAAYSSPGGIAYIVGTSHDVERYNTVDVPKNDYFAGVTLFGYQPFHSSPPVDFTILPAILTSTASNDPTQANTQYRTNLTTTLRLIESTSDRVWVSFPFRQDTAIEGPSYFDNYRMGLHLAGATTAKQLPAKLNFDVGYDFQSFYNIDKPVHLFGARLSLQLCGETCN
jgi:hypothetical protein